MLQLPEKQHIVSSNFDLLSGTAAPSDHAHVKFWQITWLEVRLAWASRAAKKRGVRAANAAEEMPVVRPRRGVPTEASLGVMDIARIADAALYHP